MSSQKEEQPKVSTLRKIEAKKEKETPKNTIAAISMKSSDILMKLAKNDDYDDDNEEDAHKELYNLGKSPKKQSSSHFEEKSKTQSFNSKG